MNYSLTLKLHSLKDVVIKWERDRKESMHHGIVACELEIKKYTCNVNKWFTSFLIFRIDFHHWKLLDCIAYKWRRKNGDLKVMIFVSQGDKNKK